MCAKRLKKLVTISLFLLGIVELFYGILPGRLHIYAQEAPFARALKLQELSPEQGRAYNHYIDLFQDQWHVVAIFGALTIAGSATLWISDKKGV